MAVQHRVLSRAPVIGMTTTGAAHFVYTAACDAQARCCSTGAQEMLC